MSETKRKNFSGQFKAKVALEAIRGIKTVNQDWSGIWGASDASRHVEEGAARAGIQPV